MLTLGSVKHGEAAAEPETGSATALRRLAPRREQSPVYHRVLSPRWCASGSDPASGRHAYRRGRPGPRPAPYFGPSAMAASAMAASARICTSARRVLRVGGVPEHFSTPWHTASKAGLFAAQGIDLQWTNFPGGTGAMAKALRRGCAVRPRPPSQIRLPHSRRRRGLWRGLRTHQAGCSSKRTLLCGAALSRLWVMRSLYALTLRSFPTAASWTWPSCSPRALWRTYTTGTRHA
jgi:hypothetical protein